MIFVFEILECCLNSTLVLVISCRRNILEKKLADAEVSEEEQNNLLKYLEKKETEYMRLQRHKMGADDFILTVTDATLHRPQVEFHCNSLSQQTI